MVQQDFLFLVLTFIALYFALHFAKHEGHWKH